jgi:esterase/lipase superfamily enzyme
MMKPNQLPAPMHLVLLLSLALAVGCSGNKPKPNQVFLMPAPDVYEEGEIDPFDGNDRIVQGDIRGILYATDRMPVTEGDKKKHEFYSDKRANALYLGQARVSLGKDKDMTWEEARRVSLLKNRTKNFPLQVASIEEFGVLERSITPFDGTTPRSSEPGDTFSAEIDRMLERSDSKDVFIYVHGYKVNFANPVLVASELWHFMGYEGAFIAYSWPATFNFTAYLSDIEDATRSARSLRSLIVHISETTNAERIHILGYSTGTRLVARTVADLGMYAYGFDEAEVREHIKIGNVLLVGSDMDVGILAGYLLDGALDVCESFTVYQSAADKTLNMSKFVFGKNRSGQKIEGDVRNDKVIEFMTEHPELRVIDISHAANITQNSGHSYFRTSPWVSSDVLMTFRYNLDPESRGLVLDEEGVGWEFPEDYVERLRTALRANLEGYDAATAPTRP